MKKVLMLLVLVAGAWCVGCAQPGTFNYHKQRVHYISLMTDSLQGLPADTFFVQPAFRSLHWIAAKGDSIYKWSPTLVRWVLYSAAGGGGSITGTGTANRIAYWNGTTNLTSSPNLTYDGITFSLGAGKFTVNSSGQISRFENITPGPGNLMIGNGGVGAFKMGSLTSSDGSITINYNSPNIDITNSAFLDTNKITAFSPLYAPCDTCIAIPIANLEDTGAVTPAMIDSILTAVRQHKVYSDGAGKDSIYSYNGYGDSSLMYVVHVPIPDGWETVPSVNYSGTPNVYNIGSGTFRKNGSYYDVAPTQLTIDAADASQFRWASFVSDTSGHSSYLSGTLAATENAAIKPIIDPSFQIGITDLMIKNSGSGGVALDTIFVYKNNEVGNWTLTNTGTTTDADNTANVWEGTKAINVTNINNGDVVQLAKGSTVDISTKVSLNFFLRLKTVMPNAGNLNLRFYNGTTPVSNNVVLTFSKTNVTGYQPISVNLAGSSLTSNLITAFRITYTSNNNTNFTGFFADYIYFQSGIPVQPPPSISVTSISSGDTVITYTTSDGAIHAFKYGMKNPMNSVGDMIIGGSSGTPTELNYPGDDDYFLFTLSGSPTWGSVFRKFRTTKFENTGTSVGMGSTFTTNVFTGSSTSTWSLPFLSSYPNQFFFFKNAGTANMIIQRSGSDEIWTNTNVTSITLTPGQSATLVAGTNYWLAMFDGSGGGTPTFQQVLTAGSTLTTNNTVSIGTTDLNFTGTNAWLKVKGGASGSVEARVNAASDGFHVRDLGGSDLIYADPLNQRYGIGDIGGVAHGTGIVIKDDGSPNNLIDLIANYGRIWNGVTQDTIATRAYARSVGGGGGAGITVGTSTITSGTTTRVLFNNAGVLGEYTISGSGNVAMTTSPSFTTPALGVATATSINKVAITAPATSATLTIANGKTLTANNSITFAGTDATTMTFPSTTATIARTDAAQTFTGVQTFATVTINAGTTSVPQITFNAGTPTTTPIAGAAETNSSSELMYSTSTTTASRGYVQVNRYATTATSTTLTANNDVIEVTATGQTITLPTAVGAQGREYTIKLTAAGSCTVATTSSQTIDGKTTYLLNAQNKFVTVKSNNANWLVVSVPEPTYPMTQTLQAYKDMGSSVVGESLGMSIFDANNTTNLGASTGRYIPLYLPTAQTIKGITWFQVTQGSYTANNNNRIGLYSIDTTTGTYTLVASTTNDNALWSTAASGTFGKKDFTTPYAAAAGVYIVVLVYNSSAQTTAPALGTAPNLIGGAIPGLDFVHSIKLGAITSFSTADLPATKVSSTLENNGGRIWVGAYK